MCNEPVTSDVALPDLDWAKGDGLLPVIVQDADTLRVLMLGYMNSHALQVTQRSRLVTFYSRSKQRLWTKGERSGHVLHLVAIDADCDADTLLVQARPRGPTCHLGRTSCFPAAPGQFLGALDALVVERERERPQDSYTTALLSRVSAVSRRRSVRKGWRPHWLAWSRLMMHSLMNQQTCFTT